MIKYISRAFDGMTKGLFASLIVGTVVFELGDALNSEWIMNVGMYAKYLMGPAIAVGIAKIFDMKPITTAAAVIVGAITAGTITPEGIAIGDPLTCLIGSLLMLELLNRIETGKTLDIFLVPFTAIVLSGIVFVALSPLTMIMNQVSIFINESVALYPIISSAFIATIFALFISGPLSSAALAIILGIEGTAAFVAVVATSSQMAGFFIMSIEDNGIIDSLLILFGSSKLQLKNIALNRKILLPPLVASIIGGIIVGTFSGVISVETAAGMGNCALIGPLLTLEANAYSPESVAYVMAFCFIVPMIISYAIYFVMKKRSMIRRNDLKL